MAKSQAYHSKRVRRIFSSHRIFLFSIIFIGFFTLVQFSVLADCDTTPLDFASPRYSVFAGGDATASGTVESTTHLRMDYNFPSDNGYVGIVHTFDDYGTQTVESADLSSLSEIKIGMTTQFNSEVKFEIKDLSGNTNYVTFSNASGSEVCHAIPLSLFSGVNLAQTREVNVVLDGSQNQHTSQTLNLHFGFYSNSESNPDPNLNSSNVTILDPFGAGGFSGNGATQTFTTLSRDQVQIDYDLHGSGYAGIYHSYDNPDTPNTVEVINLNSLGSVVFGVTAPSQASVKIEAHDINNVSDYVYLTGQDGANEKFYRVPASYFLQVDRANIKELVFVIDGPQTGALKVRFGHYAYDPTILPDPNTNQNDITPQPFVAENGIDSDGSGGNAAQEQFQVSSTTRAQITYQVNHPDAFVGIYHNFSGATNLSGVSELIFGVQAPASTKIKLELRDSSDHSDFIILDGNDGNEHFYRAALNMFDTVDLSAITGVNFVIDGVHNSNPSGVFKLRFGDYTLNVDQAGSDQITPVPILNLGTVRDQNSTAVLSLVSHNVLDLQYQVNPQGFSGLFQSFAGSSLNLNNFSYFILGVRGPQGLKPKLEIKDSSGQTASVFLIGLDSNQHQYALQPGLLAGIDTNQVQEINLILDGSSNPNQQGTMRLFLGENPVLPDPNLNEGQITRQEFNTVSLLDSDTLGSTLTWISRDRARLHYVIDAAEQIGFSGVVHSFDPPKDLSSVSQIIFGMQAPALARIKFELKDSANHVGYIYLSGANDTERLYSVNPTLIPEVNLSAISQINFVVEKNSVQDLTGDVTLNLGHYPFEDELSPDANSGAGDVTYFDFNLAGAVNSDNATAVYHATSPDQSTLDYTTGNETTFAGTYHQFTDAQNLSSTSAFVIGLRGASTLKTKFEVKDSSDHTDYVILKDLPNQQEAFYRIPAALLEGINLSQVKEVNLIVEGRLNQNQTGSLDLRFGHHSYEDELSPNPNLHESNVTPVQNYTNGGFDGGGATQTFTITSDISSELNYNLNQTGFVGVYHGYDDPATQNQTESFDYQSFGQLVVGVLAPNETRVKLEIKDIADSVNFVYLIGQDGSNEKFYAISPSRFSSIDKTHVKEINLVVEGSRNPIQEGVLRVHFGFYPFDPEPVSPNPNLGIHDITLLPILTFGTFNSTDSAVTFEQTSSTQIGITYQLIADGYVGAYTRYENPQNLSALNDFVFGLNAPQNALIRLELKDQVGSVQKIRFGGFDGVNEQFYGGFRNLFHRVDLTRISEINWVVLESDNRQIPNGSATIRFGVFPFQESEIDPDPNHNASDITLLPGQPRTNLTGGSFAGADILQVSNAQIDFVYSQLIETGRFAGATIRYDDFSTQTIETGDLSGFSELVLGLSATGTRRLKIEVVDNLDRRITLPIGQISTNEQYYSIRPDRYIGLVDFAHVRFINFIVDSEIVEVSKGLLHIKTNGLYFAEEQLTQEEESKRQSLMADQLHYFTIGVGVDSVKHLPYDNLDTNGNADHRSQPTAMGFYLQILGEVARGHLNNGMSRTEALQEGLNAVNSLITLQSDVGWNGTGLLPTFVNLDTMEVGDYVSFGDNSNLSQSVAVYLGLINSLSGLSNEEQALVSELTTKGEQILDQQGSGYAQFYDSSQNRFRLSFNRTTNQFEYHVDRLSNEFRSGVAFVVTRFADVLPGNANAAWYNLIQAYKTYTDEFGTAVPNLVPYDGGAFQIFWPLLWTNEQKIVNIKAAQRNFFYTQTEYSYRYRIPGFLSASFIPEDQYVGALGIPEAAEKDFPYANVFDVGSLYGLGSAYSLAPKMVIRWLDRITTQFPQFTSANGTVDAFRSGSEYSNRLLAIDQGSMILGLLGGGGNDLEAYLQARNEIDDYKSLYSGLHLTISSVDREPQNPPTTFPVETLSVLNHFEGEGVIGNTPFTNTSVYGTTIAYTNDFSDFGGHYWTLPQNFNARGLQLLVTHTEPISPGEFRIELKDENDGFLGSFPVHIQSDDQFIRDTFDVPDQPAFENVRRILFVVEPNGTGIHTANIFLHQITFRRFEGNVNCDDGNVCNGIETLVNGDCVAGVPLDCNDQSACTNDSCDPISGCGHANIDCNDNDACTQDSCLPASGCQNAVLNCDDQNTCTADSCDNSLGCQHSNLADQTSCADGTICNGDEICQGGVCQPGNNLDCDDHNPCTSDSCDPVTGCRHDNVTNGTLCPDGNQCNGAETCQAGQCTDGTPPNCDDHNICTSDSCNPSSGCVNDPVSNGTSCTDSDACNGAETCQAGTCSPGSPLDCDDHNPCTSDSCDAALGCRHVNVTDGTSCGDGDVCNGAEVCQTGTCGSGTPLNCNDSDACTTDSCNSSSGCQHSTISCNDNNPCTADSCNSQNGCEFVPVTNGTSCSDGDLCNGSETCQAGSCTTGTPVNCNDSNACTTDACNPTNGACQHDAVSCNDNNPCTSDSCDASSGCGHAAVTNGTSCSDSDLCNGSETCQSGSCASGTTLNCDDSNACTADSCSATEGCAHSAVSCDDNDACTADSCNPSSGCAHTAIPNCSPANGGNGGGGGTGGTGGNGGGTNLFYGPGGGGYAVVGETAAATQIGQQVSELITQALGSQGGESGKGPTGPQMWFSGDKSKTKKGFAPEFDSESSSSNFTITPDMTMPGLNPPQQEFQSSPKPPEAVVQLSPLKNTLTVGPSPEKPIESSVQAPAKPKAWIDVIVETIVSWWNRLFQKK